METSNYASHAFFRKKDENYAGNDKSCQNYASTIYQNLLTVCLFFLESSLSDFERSLGFFLHWGMGRTSVETENPGQIH